MFPSFGNTETAPCYLFVSLCCVRSERAKQTEAQGERFEESKNINKSLLTLGNVIESEFIAELQLLTPLSGEIHDHEQDF